MNCLSIYSHNTLSLSTVYIYLRELLNKTNLTWLFLSSLELLGQSEDTESRDTVQLYKEEVKQMFQQNLLS